MGDSPRRAVDGRRLLAIVGAALLARVGVLWIGRSEFTGWFNHTYYSWVQIRGLLEQGSLPYPDMPGLFHLNALLARGLILLGLDPDSAIVAATRSTMCVVPALVPLAIYGMVRNLNGSEPVRPRQWTLVPLSGFLPLSLAHLPELLQKNTLGLLLLAILILLSQRLLRRLGFGDALLAAVVALAIVLTHFGSAAAMLLFGSALLVADSIVRRSPRRLAVAALALATVAGLALEVVHRLDAQRFERILLYARESLGRSLVAALFDPSRGRAAILASLGAILLFYALLFVAHRAGWQRRSTLPAGERVFFLANLLLCGFLVLPLLDQHLMGRLALFVPLPLLVVLLHVERDAAASPRWKTAGLAALASIVVALALGEVLSARIRARDHDAVLADLERLRTRVSFGPRDLVLTTAAADHACNWFLRVRAGVVTSLELDDFARSDNVYVLNGIGGGFDPRELAGRSADDEFDRYLFMRSAIPRPEGVAPLFATDRLELFRLDGPPPSWRFDADGGFLSYGP